MAPTPIDSPPAPAKLLLFGEHTVLHGSSALAVPLRAFSASLHVDASAAAGTPGPSAQPFADWLAHARSRADLAEALDLDAWARDAPRLRVASDIPQGYGVGSSGALTALVYRRYARTSDTFTPGLRDRLAALEGYFHGDSSGLDPLVCFTELPVRLRAGGATEFLRTRIDLSRWFLLDSGRPRSGRAAIARFTERARDATWRAAHVQPVADLADRLAERFLARAIDPESLRELSERQLAGFGFLIPGDVAAQWRGWLRADTAYLKLCGAGAGGFYLGYAVDRAALRAGPIASRLTWL